MCLLCLLALWYFLGRSNSSALKIGNESNLAVALRWWREVLSLHIVESRAWKAAEGPLVHLFADARGSPPRLAAVLLIDGDMRYTDLVPDKALLECFAQRRDAQIMGLEILAIVLGLCTFAPLISDRKVIVWSDNSGSERATSAGKAKKWDHSSMVHGIWILVAKLRVTFFAHAVFVVSRRIFCQASLWVERVPTEANISDLPSREEFALLESLGAVYTRPEVFACFRSPQSFAALSAKGVF